MRTWGLGAASTVVIAGVLMMIGARVQAQPYSGSGDYQVYCASCHGAEARGDGMLAKSLKKRPADLTQLARHNNGVFPDEKVFKTVDGRQPGSAHSDADMPAWGEVFAKASESASPERTAARIDTLVKYLQTLQAK